MCTSLINIVLTLTIQVALSDELVTPDRSTPGHVVVNVKDRNAVRQWRRMTRISPAASAARPSRASTPAIVEDRGIPLTWESEIVLRSSSGQDSFRVSSSRTGCPGTEVRPSVAVSFATDHGWSDPPIRFGPLTSKGICPLGKGMELEVRSTGSTPPFVKLVERSRQMTER